MKINDSPHRQLARISHEFWRAPAVKYGVARI